MERKEMIEKVANMICENETQCNSCLKCTIYDGKICCKHLRVAGKLVDTIIPEGSVVLTKEDLQKYAKDCLIGEVAGYDILQMAFARANRWREEARKDTAKEYHDKMAKVFYERDYVEGYAKIGLDEENDEILKDFGVEVEE